MKIKIAVLSVVVVAVVFVLWCYHPSQNVSVLAFKLKVPLPALYSRCLSQLATLGTQDATELLLHEYRNAANHTQRMDVAKALHAAKWQPSDRTELVSFLALCGLYEDAAALGTDAIEPLLAELREVAEPDKRSRLCAVLLKSGDKRALVGIQAYLHEKLARIGAIVQTALPAEAQASATIQEVSPTARRVLITGHLLEGEKPSDNSPYVRGDYGSRERLELKAKYRSFQIYQSIFRDVPMSEFDSVVIQCKHGIRVQTMTFGSFNPSGTGGTDQAMTIFETLLTPEEAGRINWQSATLPDVERVWKVEQNIIPSLQFIAVPGGIR